jgi:uncharacterized protein
MISPDTHSAAAVIQLFGLAPLPHEGGWYRRVTESRDEVSSPADAARMRPAGTLEMKTRRRAWSAIHALFTPDGFSALHRLDADEIWCFHAGDPLEALRLSPDFRGERVWLGLDPTAGQHAHDVVRAGTWQGTRLQAGGRWALVSCVVVPEFAWSGFQAGTRAELVRLYPEWAHDIQALTRDIADCG